MCCHHNWWDERVVGRQRCKHNVWAHKPSSVAAPVLHTPRLRGLVGSDSSEAAGPASCRETLPDESIDAMQCIPKYFVNITSICCANVRTCFWHGSGIWDHCIAGLEGQVVNRKSSLLVLCTTIGHCLIAQWDMDAIPFTSFKPHKHRAVLSTPDA